MVRLDLLSPDLCTVGQRVESAIWAPQEPILGLHPSAPGGDSCLLAGSIRLPAQVIRGAQLNRALLSLQVQPASNIQTLQFKFEALRQELESLISKLSNRSSIGCLIGPKQKTIAEPR